MEQFFNNPGLSHIGRNIFEQLNLNELESCKRVCKSWKIILENPRFWLKTCINNASKFNEAPPEVSDGSGTLGFCKCHGEMHLWQIEQGFSSFFVIFEDLLIRVHCRKHYDTLKNH